ncbi:hypothetical protein Tco_0953278 [Tanacetum coccineum]|uniref:Uncharacterized protein n=1 Tax=Tanacetum coccineum TaxID=301880 RepID=A0ABQ5E271_9ASTR
MPELMRDGLFARMVMEHRDDARVVVFTSQAWGRLFDTREPLVWELILEFLSTLRFGEVLLDLDALDTIQFQLGGARRRLSLRQFNLALGLHTEEETKSLGFARTPPSYTLIRDPVLRLCHRMMTHSIAGRSHAPEKILQGLTVIAPTLLVIDMAELMRLQICMEIDDTWAWEPWDQRGSPMLRLVPLRPLRMLLLMMRVARLFWYPYRHLSYHHLQLLLGLCPRDYRDLRRRCRDCVGMLGVYMDLHSMRLSMGAHLRHSRDAPGRGLARPAPPQPSRTNSS